MALVLNDRVKETTTTTGTSSFALGGAVTGFQTFSAGVGANNTTYYAIASGSDWEVGLGTLSSDGLTLARTTILQSSNSDSIVTFGSGSKDIFCTYPASKAVTTDTAVVAPASSTDNAIARFDSTTGKLIQNSGITISDTGSLNLAGALDEKVYAVVDAAGVALSPQNGTIQTWTLGASRTPTAGTWSEGESMTLMINDGTAYTVTWTTLAVTWVGGSAPTLATTGSTVVELWKVGSTIYGALVGSVA